MACIVSILVQKNYQCICLNDQHICITLVKRDIFVQCFAQCHCVDARMSNNPRFRSYVDWIFQEVIVNAFNHLQSKYRGHLLVDFEKLSYT